MRGDNKIVKARPLTNNPLTDIAVDIIIPFKDNTVGVSSLLEEIFKFKGIKYRVHLVDDNSRNKNFVLQYTSVPWINVHQFREDKGFGYSVNHAVKGTENNINIVMHSDVYALPLNFMKDMVLGLAYARVDKVSVISAQIDNPVPKSCSYLLPADGITNNDPYYRVLNDPEHFVPFTCVAFYKNEYSKAGGLPPYPYCWFEDRLLNDKLRAFGNNVAVSNRVMVRHKGSATISKVLEKNPEIKQVLKNNKKTFDSDHEMMQQFLKKKTV